MFHFWSENWENWKCYKLRVLCGNLYCFKDNLGLIKMSEFILPFKEKWEWAYLFPYSLKPDEYDKRIHTHIRSSVVFYMLGSYISVLYRSLSIYVFMLAPGIWFSAVSVQTNLTGSNAENKTNLLCFSLEYTQPFKYQIFPPYHNMAAGPSNRWRLPLEL